MKTVLIIVAVVISITATVVASTDPRYHREMRRQKPDFWRKVLKTDHGDIEYAVQGEGNPGPVTAWPGWWLRPSICRQADFVGGPTIDSFCG